MQGIANAHRSKRRRARSRTRRVRTLRANIVNIGEDDPEKLDETRRLVIDGC